MAIELIIITLAAWRLTNAVNREKIGVFIRRKFAGERPDPVVPNEYTYKDTFLSSLIMCFMCLSFWVSVGCFILWQIYPPFLYPFAISTAVIFIDKVD